VRVRVRVSVRVSVRVRCRMRFSTKVSTGARGKHTLRMTLIFIAPALFDGATSSIMRGMSFSMFEMYSWWSSRCARSHRCSMKYIIFARRLMLLCSILATVQRIRSSSLF
jgi:hypothetical protein